MSIYNKTSTIISALDIGSSKVSCIIAKVGKDNKPHILGYGYNSSKGIKNGIISDITSAIPEICNAVESAEQMAKIQIENVIVNISNSQLFTDKKQSSINLNNKPITELEINKVIEKAISKITIEDGELVHCIPSSFNLDDEEYVKDPIGLYGKKLGVNIFIGSCSSGPIKNLESVIEGSRLNMAAKAFSPYASGLSCLVKDEKDLGATIIDMGGGTTSIATFKNGHLVHASSIPVGGINVTNDIAYGLTTSVVNAERLKTLQGCAFVSSKDNKELINIHPVGEEDDDNIRQVPKIELNRIIAARIEETFELVAEQLKAHGTHHLSNHRIVLTGGASQLPGVREIANLVLNKQIRLGKPKNLPGLPENLITPAFATNIGLLNFVLSYSERQPKKIISGTSKSAMSANKILKWFKQNI